MLAGYLGKQAPAIAEIGPIENGAAWEIGAFHRPVAFHGESYPLLSNCLIESNKVDRAVVM